MPRPAIDTIEGAKAGIIAFGSTEPAIREARDQLLAQGIKMDFMRIKAVPFTSEVQTFIQNHDRLYVIEMNRDGQLHQLLSLEYPDQVMKLISLAHTDGLPLTARRVRESILAKEEK